MQKTLAELSLVTKNLMEEHEQQYHVYAHEYGDSNWNNIESIYKSSHATESEASQAAKNLSGGGTTSVSVIKTDLDHKRMSQAQREKYVVGHVPSEEDIEQDWNPGVDDDDGLEEGKYYRLNRKHPHFNEDFTHFQ